MSKHNNLLEKLKKDTAHMSTIEKLSFGFRGFFKALVLLIWSLIKFGLALIYETLKMFLKTIFLIFALVLFFAIGYQFLLALLGAGDIPDFSKYQGIIIVSATLCFLVIEFMRMTSKDKKMNAQKKAYLRQSAEMLFSSTIYFSVVFIVSLLYNVTTNYTLKLFSITYTLYEVDQDKLVTLLILLFGFIAVFNLFHSLYQLLTKIGTIYEFPEETDDTGFFEKVKKRASTLR